MRTVLALGRRFESLEAAGGPKALSPELWLRVLEFCARDWFPGPGEDHSANEAAARRMLAQRKRCAWCWWVDPTAKRCRGCKAAWFCGAACQNESWAFHKQRCKSTTFSSMQIL